MVAGQHKYVNICCCTTRSTEKNIIKIKVENRLNLFTLLNCQCHVLLVLSSSELFNNQLLVLFHCLLMN